MQMDITKLSNKYRVRKMSDNDEEILRRLFTGNTLYYQYCRAELDEDNITADLHIAPPGIDMSDKYYVGFFEDDKLIAVMDLIDGYPGKDISFIGFFMVDAAEQGKGTGSDIISKVMRYLKEAGFKEVHLGIDKGNPQSTHFWDKNGFNVIREVPGDGWTILYGVRKL